MTHPMTDELKIALAQCNPTMGAIDDNVAMGVAAWREGAGLGADLVVLPELFLCPWQGCGIALTAGDEGWLLRYGDYRGLKCNAQALPAMLDLVKRDVDTNEIVFYASETESAPELEGFTIDRRNGRSVSMIPVPNEKRTAKLTMRINAMPMTSVR